MPFASVFRNALFLFGTVLIALSSTPLQATVAPSVADGFNPNVQGAYNSIGPVVYALVLQSDGDILIGGSFTSVAPRKGTSYAHNNIARLHPDGSNDSSFNVDVNGQINTILVQSDGRILIGGKFTTVNGATRNNAARLYADGTLDSTFNPNTSGSVTGLSNLDTSEVVSMTIQSDGKIYITGGFSKVTPDGGSTSYTRYGIARFNADGSFDDTFADAGVNGQVNAAAVQADGQVVIGGAFTLVAGSGTKNFFHIARLSASGVLDSTFDPSADGAVNAILIQADGLILIGGAFDTLLPNDDEDATSTCPRLARLLENGDIDDTFAPVPDGPVSALKMQADGRLLVVGQFSTSSGGMGSYVGRLLPDGEVDTTFFPSPNQSVYAVDVQADGSVLLGGIFTALATNGVTSEVRNCVARVSPYGDLDTDFRPDLNGRFKTMAVDSSGRIIVSGSFTSIAGVTRDGLMRIAADGTVDSTFSPQISGGVVTKILPLSDGRIMIAGAFTSVNNTARSYIARLYEDGTVDETFSAQPDAAVTSILVQGEKYIIGGSFSALSPGGTTEPITRYSIARLYNDGSVDLTFTAKVYSSITAMLMQSDGKFIIAGSFTSIIPTGTTESTSVYHLARLGPNGGLDTTFLPSMNGTVFDGIIQSDGQIVLVGSFTQVAGTGSTTYTSLSNIVRLSSTGVVDTTFNPKANDIIQTILPVTAGYLLGGYFTKFEEPGNGFWVDRHFAAILNNKGEVDDAVFDLGIEQLAGNGVFTFANSTDGKIYVGGSFASLNFGTSSHHRLARFSLDSVGAVTIDETFHPELSSGLGATVNVITQQSDNSLLVAGAFSGVGGTTSSNLALFYVDGAPDSSFYPNVGGTSGYVQSVAQLPGKGQTIVTQRSGFAWLESDGQLRTGIVKGTDPSSFSSARAIEVQEHDGKVLVSASVVRPPSDDYPAGTPDYLVRFKADGSFDTDFYPFVNSTVLAMKVQSDNKILIGGSFTSIGLSTAYSRYYMARLNEDGSVDTTFYPDFGGGIATIELQSDGKILAGGTYTTVTGTGNSTLTYRNYITRLKTDGTIDTTFNPCPDSTVRAIKVMPSGKILVGGLFTSFQPGATGTEYTRNYLALLNADGSLDSSVYGLNGYVSRIVEQEDGKYIIAGSFTVVLGKTRHYIARLNADLTLDEDFNPNPVNEVYSVAIQPDNMILIAGAFTALQPGYTSYDPALATPRRYTARLNLDGTLDSSFNPNFNDAVNCIASYPDGSVLCGGTFTSIQPTGSVLVGGSFSKISGVDVTNLALFSTDGSVSATFLPNPNGVVYATQVTPDSRFVVGGAFTTIGGETRNHVARFTAKNVLDTTFNPNVDDDVRSIAIQADGKYLLGGKFKTVGGSGHNYLARIASDGSVDNSFNASVSGEVSAILVQADQHIIVLSAGSGVRSTVTRLNTDGSVDTTFTAVNGADKVINAIALQTDGHVVVGGAFTTIAGYSKSYIARLKSDGSFDDTFTIAPNGPVSALMISPDGKILLGGQFSKVDGLPRFGLARLSPTDTTASSFSANIERSVLTWTRSGSGPEITGTLFQGSTDGATWVDLGVGERIVGTPNWKLADLTLPADVRYFVRAFGDIAGSSQGSSGVMEARGQVYLSAVPVITSATAVSATVGTSFTYAVSATGKPTSYTATGLPAGLTLLSGGVISGTPTQSGTYTVTITATNSAGSTSFVLTIYVAASGASADTSSRLANLAVLSRVDGTNLLIAGFVVSGTGTQTVLVRAVGPGLTKLGVTDVLKSPHLKIYRAGKSSPFQESDAWGGSTLLSDAATRLGAQPLDTDSKDAAFLVTLDPGAYTIHITDGDDGNGGTGGYALAEVYDASVSPTVNSPRLVNISARGIANGTTMVIGGFVITGTTSKTVLIRGIGPGLADTLEDGVLTDSKLELVRNVNGTNVVIAQNDNWCTPYTYNSAYPAASAAEIAATATAVGAFSLQAGSNDAVLLITLPPGVYSAQVSNVGNYTGAAMAEIYEVTK